MELFEHTMKKKIMFEVINASCHKYTFDAPIVKRWVQKRLRPPVLNLFAGKNVLHPREYRVDLDPTMPELNYVGDAQDYLNEHKDKVRFNTVIYDPPWNERKAKEFYEGRYIGKFTKLKEDIAKIVSQGGIIISAGYEISNFGKKRGFEIIDGIIVNPGGEMKPYFVVIEEKTKHGTTSLEGWI